MYSPFLKTYHLLLPNPGNVKTNISAQPAEPQRWRFLFRTAALSAVLLNPVMTTLSGMPPDPSEHSLGIQELEGAMGRKAKGTRFISHPTGSPPEVSLIEKLITQFFSFQFIQEHLKAFEQMNGVRRLMVTYGSFWLFFQVDRGKYSWSLDNILMPDNTNGLVLTLSAKKGIKVITNINYEHLFRISSDFDRDTSTSRRNFLPLEPIWSMPSECDSGRVSISFTWR